MALSLMLLDKKQSLDPSWWMVYTHLDIREVRLECVGAGIACVEEHELGFLQMTGRQALLGVHMRPVKEIHMSY